MSEEEEKTPNAVFSAEEIEGEDEKGLSGGRKKNGHKQNCKCHICANMMRKAARKGYSKEKKRRMMGGSTKKNGHDSDCKCPICKNMKNARGGKTRRHKKRKMRGGEPLSVAGPDGDTEVAKVGEYEELEQIPDASEKMAEEEAQAEAEAMEEESMMETEGGKRRKGRKSRRKGRKGAPNHKVGCMCFFCKLMAKKKTRKA